LDSSANPARRGNGPRRARASVPKISGFGVKRRTGAVWPFFNFVRDNLRSVANRPRRPRQSPRGRPGRRGAWRPASRGRRSQEPRRDPPGRVFQAPSGPPRASPSRPASRAAVAKAQPMRPGRLVGEISNRIDFFPCGTGRDDNPSVSPVFHLVRSWRKSSLLPHLGGHPELHGKWLPLAKRPDRSGNDRTQ
jgi:hypothetical protein